ncbi:MAG: hypothetical protein ACOX2F_02770 [bacterium]
MVHKQARDYGLSDPGWDDDLFPDGVPYIYDSEKGGVVNEKGELINPVSYLQMRNAIKSEQAAEPEESATSEE